MTLMGKSSDNLTLTFLSDWFIVSVDPNFHGYYQDQWQNPYTVLYFPEQTHPDLDFPEIFGDFNADDKVDFYDLALYADHWQDSVEDPNTSYDAMYEDPNTWDGEISTTELKAFVENWLWQEAGGMSMGGGESMASSSGFTETLYTEASAEQHQPPADDSYAEEPDMEEIIKWLEELWLTDERARQVIDEDAWLKFMESLKEQI